VSVEKLRELSDKGFIRADQFERLEPILSGKIKSVFYELRSLLYLGVMLFTTGVGILVYQNIGDIGHILSIIALSLLTVACFGFAFIKAAPYSNGKITPPLPYYDYIVLLGSLLFVSVLGYLQFQYGILTENLGVSTLVSAVLFFFVGYRLDHLGVLSLGITALASYWGLSLSPQKWYADDFFSSANLHLKAMVFGAAISAFAVLLDRRDIKKHFTFTYINFASLSFLAGALASMFINDKSYGPYLLLLYAGCTGCVYFARWKKSFLFLLYAFIFAYIGTTFLMADILPEDPALWFLYLMASCGGFIFFIIRYKNYFKR